jgi:type II restriction enzyme
MKLRLNTNLAHTYKSKAQKIRVMSEAWTLENAYCPVTGKKLKKYKNNKPVGDFYCKADKEDFELKAKKNCFGSKIVDGAYSTMMERLFNFQNPNLFLLAYNAERGEVMNFSLVPKHFFIPQII